jgi:hypothetical protein
MIERVACDKSLPPNVTQNIIERTDGIPLFNGLVPFFLACLHRRHCPLDASGLGIISATCPAIR